MLLMANNMQVYFREALDSALKSSNIQVTESAQFYVINLLNLFSRSENAFAGIDYGEKFNMTHLLTRALEADDREAFEIFRHLGDSALYMLGFFGESRLQRIVSESYYREMGSRGYAQASALTRAHGAKTAALFQEMAERFNDVAHVIKIMSKYGQRKV